MKKLWLLCVPVILLFSCNNDDEVADDSCDPQTDQANITNELNSIPQCISDIEQGEAMELVNNFVEFNEGDVIEMFDTEELENWAENILTLITDNVIDTELEGDWADIEWTGPDDQLYFDFDSNTGVYNWNASTSSYDVNSGGSGIEINFPSDPDQNTNNATFRMLNYSDYDWYNQEENIWISWPTAMYCELEVDNEVVFSINHSVDFGDSFEVDGFELPNAISVEVFADPITVSLQANRVNSTFFNASFLVNGGDCDISAVATTQLLTDEYLDILNDEDALMENVDYISVDISVADMTLDGILDCQVLYDLTDGDGDEVSIEDMNTAAGVDVVYDGDEVASLKLVSDSDGDVDGVHVVYCDDSEESVAAYINPLMNSIETVLYPYAGFWWDNIE